ncbi:TRAP transporter substrate-binding protein [Nesterenkonia ebinurensis]|uniref:TRAP transporter substrate-binding protein n=1 Tax=Nesterenkonia ebinurensis TaxID=2608252 RepID=UPI00123E1DB1|nr:TRAP transporter substrate-binding protein [Nesterenkonia ebinurensis]
MHARIHRGKRLTTLTAVAALALTITACGDGGDGGDAEAQTLRLGHVFGVESSQNAAAEVFAERVEERTDGELEVSVYPASQLGGDEALGRDLASGSLDLAFLNPGSLAGMDPLMDFHYLPYIVQDYDVADEIFFGEGIIPETLEEILAEHGMDNLALFELEFRSVTNDVRPIESLEDLRGLRLRVPGSEAIRGYFDAAGVQTQVMPMDELITGLEQGTVDGQDNGVLITRDAGLTGSQSYMTPTRHVYAVGSIVASTTIFEGLDPEQAQILEEVAQEVAQEQIEDNRSRVEEYTEALAEDGIEVTELSEEQMQEFQDFGLDMWDDFAATYGEDRIATLRDEIEALG